MDLILWRHAEAEEGTPDDSRVLTRRGEKQAQRMAKWLKPRLRSPLRVLASPAIRAQQTAEALGHPIETFPELDVGAPAQHVLPAIDWHKQSGMLVLVGHQPVLGEVAGRLLAGVPSGGDIKKGAIWWFRIEFLDDEIHSTLYAVMTPGLA